MLLVRHCSRGGPEGGKGGFGLGGKAGKGREAWSLTGEKEGTVPGPFLICTMFGFS